MGRHARGLWKLDRLGRSLHHLVNTVQDLTTRGIGFKVLTGHGAAIDTSTPSAKLVFGIFAALAEFERELIIERTRAGSYFTNGGAGSLQIKNTSTASNRRRRHVADLLPHLG